MENNLHRLFWFATEVFLMISYRSFAMVTSSVIGGSGDALSLGGVGEEGTVFFSMSKGGRPWNVWEPLEVRLLVVFQHYFSDEVGGKATLK